MVKVKVYNEEYTFKSKDEAIECLINEMRWCGPDSSEYDVYSNIIARLECGDIENNYDWE
jgi:hypothetical protein